MDIKRRQLSEILSQLRLEKKKPEIALDLRRGLGHVRSSTQRTFKSKTAEEGGGGNTTSRIKFGRR